MKNHILKIGLLGCSILMASEPYDKESLAHVLPGVSVTFLSPNNENFNAPSYFLLLKTMEEIKSIIRDTPLTNHQIKSCFPELDYVTLSFIEAIREGIMHGQ